MDRIYWSKRPEIGYIVGLAHGPDDYLYASDVETGTIWKTDLSVYVEDEAREWIHVFSTAGDSVWNIACDQTSFAVPVLWARVRDSVNGNKIIAYEIEDGSIADCPGPPPAGVCCYADGSCDVTIEAACSGTWYDEVSSCSPSDPCELGACCLPDGSCEYTQRIDCNNKNGSFHPEYASCIPSPCPPRAPCCYDETCEILSEYHCLQLDGRWHPDWSVCDSVPCPPPCSKPPGWLVAWWPLDEPDGVSVAREIVNGNDAQYRGSPTKTEGEYVWNSLYFEAEDDFLEVPNPGDGSLDMGTGDFAIGCWVRTLGSANNIQTLVDKRSYSGGMGYSFYLYKGRLGFQMAKSGNVLTNWIADGPDIRDDSWHHVGVSVKRDYDGGGSLYVDGVHVRTFDPTNYQVDIVNSAPLRIAQQCPGSHVSPCVADIDEVMVFNYNVGWERVFENIWLAGSGGQCKEDCFVPPVVSKCKDASAKKTKLTISNHTPETQQYTWSIVGLPTASGLTVDGTWADFDPRGSDQSGVVSLDAGKDATIPIVITPNVYIAAGKKMGYRAGVSSTTGGYYTADGVVTAKPDWLCWELLTGGVCDVPMGLLNFIVFPLENTSSWPETLSYVFQATSADMDSARQMVSLNGYPPGTAVSGSVALAPYSSTDLTISARFTEYDMFLPHNITMYSDVDCDGFLDAIESVQLRSVYHRKEPSWPIPKEEKQPPGMEYASKNAAVPDVFDLHQNVPNPFNPTTAIGYDVPSEGGHVKLQVFDVSGRLVRTLVVGAETPGAKTTLWDGKDNHGEDVASGVYFYRFQAPGFEKTLKLVLLR